MERKGKEGEGRGGEGRGGEGREGKGKATIEFRSPEVSILGFFPITTTFLPTHLKLLLA